MFFAFNQNNSEGYFVEDEQHGVNECLIIEADNAESAVERLSEIGEAVDGFWDCCPCCGERWNIFIEDEDGTDSPELYGEPIEELKANIFRKAIYVHYASGNFAKFKLDSSNNNV